MKKLIVGLHSAGHDGNISVYDTKTKDLKYLKFERLTGVKGQYHRDLTTWVKYLNHLQYDISQVMIVFVVEGGSFKRTFDFPFLGSEIDFVDHHLAHHWSTFNVNSIVVDAIGSQMDSLSIYKKNQPKLKLNALTHSSLGRDLEELYDVWFLGKETVAKLREENFSLRQRIHHAGHIMALSGFGRNFENLLITPKHLWSLENDQYLYKPNTWENYDQFNKKLSKLIKDESFIMNSFITSLHHYWFRKISLHLQKQFNHNACISLSGGVGHNIILNTMIKEQFPNLTATPHCGDEGLSIGAVKYGARLLGYKIKKNISDIKQYDENFGYASLRTISKVAKLIKQGKIVMWGQGWGELGPRALGYRSILADPCLENVKEIINQKVKKRAWFRPYGASVTVEDYTKYFHLNYESPWMLYQAQVRTSYKLKNITHVDGSCRIQTVSKNNPTFYKLLREFEILSGYPVLINTSMNLPGKAIVGTKKQAKIMFDNSEADVLVIGDNIYEK